VNKEIVFDFPGKQASLPAPDTVRSLEMKVSIERSALLKAMSQAQSVVERRNTIPILANVLIEAEGSAVSFRATDLDIEVVDKTLATVERPGATTVAAHTLHEIVRKLPDGAMVQLSDDGASGDRKSVV